MSLPRTVLILPVIFAMNCAQPSAQPAEKLLTFKVEKAPLKDVLSLIARDSGANIIMDSGVSGTVSRSVRDAPWREVLAAAVKSCGMKLVWEKHDIVRISAP